MSARTDPWLLKAVAPGRDHIPSLDGLRAISIVIVLLHHFIAPLPGMPSIPGFLGVDIFFAISGFLITRLLLVELQETGGLALASFYLRRALRLTPALVVFVVVLSVFQSVFEHVELKPTVCALLYVTNYCFVEAEWLYAGPGDYLKATWSLAVEEHFYLVFPLLLLTLFKHEKRFVYGVVGSLCVVALGFRLTYALLGKSEFFLVWRTETALDMLMAGCVISIMSSHEAGRRGLGKLLQPWVLLLATAIFAVSLIGWSYGGLWIALSQSALAIWLAVLLANVLLNPEIAGVRSVLNRPFMVWLGKISYSLYLWHALVAFLGHHFQLVDTVPGAIVAMIVSAILAHASWRWIEQPVLRRRSDWARRLGVGAPRARAVPAE